MKLLPGSIPAPPELRTRYANWEWEVVWQYGAGSVTYRLESASNEVLFLKLAPTDGYPTLAAEADRMRWAIAHLPVPRVLEQGAAADVSWLLTEGLAGADATKPEWVGNPKRLVAALAASLGAFHDAPVAECPFDFRLDRALAHAAQRVADLQVDPKEDFHEEFAHLSADQALALLQRTRPASGTLAVCHGDFCAPNVLLQNWRGSGYVDLGELGVADRWWDLAVATWSVTWNYGPGYEDLFLAEYGVARDPARIDFYRLLYDLVS